MGAAVLAAALPGAVIGHFPTALAPVCSEAAGIHHASVVVTHLGPGYASPVRVCIGFSEPTISGGELLRRSQLEAGFSGAYGEAGSAVCQVDNEPTTYAPSCLGGQGPYWSIWTQPWQGTWRYSRVGVDAIAIRDGDSEGFRYIDQQHQGQPASPAGVCPAPAPTALPAPSPRSSSPGAVAAPTGTAGAAPAARSTPSPVHTLVATSPSSSTVTDPPSTAPLAAGRVSSPPPLPRAAPARASGPPIGTLAAVAVAAVLVCLLGAQLLLARQTR